MTTLPSETLGDRLRAERVKQKLSQGDVAAGLGISQPTYSSWERNEAHPEAQHLGAVARFLRQSIDDVWQSIWKVQTPDDGWGDSPLAFRLRNFDRRLAELEHLIACITDVLLESNFSGLADEDGERPAPAEVRRAKSASRSADAVRAHETIRDRADVYRQQLADTPDFAEVCPDAPATYAMSGAQTSYWKAEYTKRGGGSASWK